MNKDRAIEYCRARVLPFCQSLAGRIAAEVPGIRVEAFEGSVGGATAYDGHHFGVDCLFPEAPTDQPDNVALIIDLCHREGNLEVSADVVWGEGHVEAELLPEATLVTEAALARVVEGLPQLSEAFRVAVHRGKPGHDI